MKKIGWIILIIILIILVGGLDWYICRRNRNQSLNQISTDIPATQSSITNNQSLNTNFNLPVTNFKTGQTKKVFGQYITPQNSPVQPEKFTGYHTGVDIEQAQDNTDVPVYAISDGTVRFVGFISGYGGVIVIQFSYQNQTYTALYGHVRLSSAVIKSGDLVTNNQQLAILGLPNSTETDGERKHLHFAIHKSTTIEYSGYVQNQSELSNWIDPNIIIK